MKARIIFVVLFFLSIASYAQSTLYKPFEVDLGLVFAFPTNNDLKLGAGAYIEPKYNVTDNISVGFKSEVVIISSREILIDGDVVEVSATGVTSFLLTGDYYFTTTTIRPFVGLGTGVYILGDIDYVSDAISTAHLGNRFGLAPRAGVVAGHFRLGLEYNIIPGVEKIKSKDYVGLKIGFEIGGGKK
ncbi:MAG TPA: OmpW family outer membrane protein [Prolixibacteraceae bacterium]|nr:OmpW family outer membrane protein [Prolixibacteraceae bacterium]HLO59848.1 OmpW family outer membrane protein [Bacteroidales bacterium]HLO91127.1 OmpW family outer membrane protein [Lentimicrobium sp.]